MLEPLLKKHFGFDRFRAGQEEAVSAVLEGRDALVVMPTGSGKSLCFQLPALEMPGLSLVISPLISLMKDQVDSLARFGIPASFINSTLHPREAEERLERAGRGEVKLLYAAPERLRDSRFNRWLDRVNLSMLAVDEAHCVSHWGHDFRPDYLRLHRIASRFPQARVVALTATATGRVREDILLHLGLGREGRAAPAVFVQGFIRPNLHVAVTRCADHATKFQRVRQALEQWRTGIVYCSTRKQAERVATQLRGEGLIAPVYHGGLQDSERERIQNRFMNGQDPLVIATNAFGMGVDRSDVRFVLHWDVPGSMEAYYQEIGRAGRDGAPAWCELLYNFADVRTQEFFLEGGNPGKETVLELLGLYRRQCLKRPLARTAEAWAKELRTTRNPMAVRTATWILERAGCIERIDEPGSRSTAVMAKAEFSHEALAAQLQQAAEKETRDRAKLDALLAYVSSRECRHRQILHYFGDPAPVPKPCGACDVCAGSARPPTPLTEVQWVALQKILSAVARLDGQCGRVRVAELLKGADTKGIREAALKDHRCFGLLADWKGAEILRWIDALLRDGSLEVTPGAYPLLRLSPRGKEVMWRRAQPVLDLETPSTKVSSAKTKTVRKAAAVGPGDDSLLKALKAWRLRRALQSKLKPYQVLHNRTLEELAVRKPGSEAELAKISGIGPMKLARYGEELLEIIRGTR